MLLCFNFEQYPCFVCLGMDFGLTDTLNTKSFDKPIEEVGFFYKLIYNYTFRSS
jgi:hypothetical protein